MALEVGAVADLYGTLSDADKTYLHGQMSAAVQGLVPGLPAIPASIVDPMTGKPINTVTDGVNALVNLGNGAISAAEQFSSGTTAGTVRGIEAAIPIVAGACALIPGVGTVAAGVVGAAGALFGAAAKIFGWDKDQPPQTCNWKIGDVCFHGTKPYGTTSPTWLKIDDFLTRSMDSHKTVLDRGAQNVNWEIVQGSENKTGTYGQLAWDWYYELCGNMYMLGDRKTITADNWEWLTRTNARYEQAWYQSWNNSNVAAVLTQLGKSNLGAFLLSYCRAFLASQEGALNGFKPIDPYALLASMAEAWNHGHGNLPITYTATSTATQYPKIGNQIFDGNLHNAFALTFADKVIRGDIHDDAIGTGAQHLPVKVFGGNHTIRIHGISSLRLGKIPPTSVKKVPTKIPIRLSHVPIHATTPKIYKKDHSGIGAVGGAIAGLKVGGPIGMAIGGVAGYLAGKKL